MPLILVGGLAVLLTAFVAYGLAFLSRSTAGGTFGWLTGFLKLTAGPLIFVTDQVTKLTSWLTHAIGTHFEAVEGHAVDWLSSLTAISDYTAKSIAGIGYDLTHAIDWLVLHQIPALVKALPSAVTRVVHAVTTRVTHVERTIVKFPKLTRAQIRAAIATALPGILAPELPYFEWLRKHLKALERVIAGGAGAAFGGLLHLPRDLVGIRKRIGRLEKVIAGSIGLALVTTALARLGVTWIRCNNWKRLGRAGCNLSPDSITQLLGLVGGLALIEGGFSIVTLAEEMLAVEEDMVKLIAGAFSELDGIAA